MAGEHIEAIATNVSVQRKDLLVQTLSAHKGNYERGPDAQIEISVSPDQSKSKTLYAPLS